MQNENTTMPEIGYFMTYRHGMNPFCLKGFKIRGDLKEARKRAMAHAQVMGYKNVWVIPQYENLDAVEESRKSGTGESVLTPGEMKSMPI